MSLQDKLIEVLIQRHKDSGKPIAGILDNSIFDRLPLEEKVKILTNEAKNSPAPKFAVKDLLVHAGMGGLGSAAALAGMAAASGKSLPGFAYGTATGLGAALASILPATAMVHNYKRDKQNYEDLTKNQILKVIADRSMSSSHKVPTIDLKKYISEAESKSLQSIADYNY